MTDNEIRALQWLGEDPRWTEGCDWRRAIPLRAAQSIVGKGLAEYEDGSDRMRPSIDGLGLLWDQPYRDGCGG